MLIKNEDNIKSSINLSRKKILNFAKSFTIFRMAKL